MNFSKIRIIKLIKDYLPYFLIIVVFPAVIRLVYSFYSPEIVVTADTFGYYEAGQQMLTNKIFAHNSRPPVYPLLLNIPLFLLGKYGAAVLSPQFYEGMKLIILFQNFLGILGLFLLYQIVKHLGISKLLSTVYSFFIGGNIMLFSQERALLSESLVTFLLIVATFILIKILNKPAMHWFGILLLVFLLQLFLKPLYIAFPLIILPVVIFHQRKNRQVLIYTLFIIVTVISSALFYIRLNTVYNHYPGFSRIGDIDLLGQILYLNLPIEKAKTVTYFYNNVNDYRKIGGQMMPFRFLEYYDYQIYNHPERFIQLREFNLRVIFSNLPIFLSKTLSQTPSALLSGNDMAAIGVKTDNFLLHAFFTFLFKFYHLCQLVTLISLPVYPIFLYQYLKRWNVKLGIITILGTISLFHIFFTALFVYDDFGRLLSVIQPQLYLFSFMSAGYVFGRIKYLFCRFIIPPKP